MQDETETYVALLCGHLEQFVQRLRQIPPERWEWQPTPPAPSARILAEHAWQWLVCDRQHITNPDVPGHANVPDPPSSQQAMCDALADETERWRRLLAEMTPEQLAEPRSQFMWRPVNVRWFVYHMVQNTIYKHGQLSTLYFMLGMDGVEPYDAPFPNRLYNALHTMRERPLFRAILDADTEAAQRIIADGADVNERIAGDATPLMWASHLGRTEIVRALLASGADVHASSSYETTALSDAQEAGHAEIVALLTRAGAKR